MFCKITLSLVVVMEREQSRLLGYLSCPSILGDVTVPVSFVTVSVLQTKTISMFNWNICDVVGIKYKNELLCFESYLR